MDVEADAVTGGDRKDRVEMTADVIIDAGRIEPANEVGAVANRLVEQLLHARISEDSALREGDDLDVDEISRRLSRPEQSVKAGKAGLGVDVDMAAHSRRAESDNLTDEPPRALFNRVTEIAPQLFFASDTLGHRIAAPMRLERQTEQCFIEVDMAVDEAWNEQRAVKIDALHARLPSKARSDRRDAAINDAKIGAPAVGQRGVSEDKDCHAIKFIRRAATTWYKRSP